MIHYMTTNGLGNAWVGNELNQVRAAGIPYMLHAMRKGDLHFFSSEWARKLHDETHVIYPLPPVAFALSVLLAPFLFGGRFFRALGNGLFGKRESARGRAAALWHLLVACHWARLNRKEPISLVHSQWIHSGGTIAMYGAWLLDVPFSFTGHATDLFRDRVALEDKVQRARFIICISTYHRDFFASLGARDEQCHIAYCGIDVGHFAPPTALTPRARPRILGAGRLVEKKGFSYLIDAVGILRDRGVRIDCTIAGSGPLESELREHVERAGLGNQVTLTGEPLKQEAIPVFMHEGEVFCLPSVWSRDNDVEGLPQLLMEAMACGLPAVSTRIVGIPDLILDGETGLLVEPRDAPALSDALQRLLEEKGLIETLAAAGRQHVLRKFDIGTCLEPLIQQFRSCLADGRGSPGAPEALAQNSLTAGTTTR